MNTETKLNMMRDRHRELTEKGDSLSQHSSFYEHNHAMKLNLLQQSKEAYAEAKGIRFALSLLESNNE